MAVIIDKRKAGKNNSAENRQKFIRRYRGAIKNAVQKANQKDAFKNSKDKNKEVTISKDSIDEPQFNIDSSTGKRSIVLPGNKEFQKGDKIKRPKNGEGKSNKGSDQGEGLDEFSFVLSKEEFYDLYFEDMALPSFVKQSFKDNVKFKMMRAGYSKEGIPPRLDLLKTFKQAIARRIATRLEDKEPRFLDEIDIRYKHFTKKPIPIRTAHVFFLMDVSGSMDEYKKDLAKKCFLLMYHFLNRTYEKVEITFVRHTQEATICTEDEFFYGKENGGTCVSSGIRLINNYINDNIDIEQTNVYVAQASDGDNWDYDNEVTLDELSKLLPKIQYMAYIQAEYPEEQDWKYKNKIKDLYTLYSEIADQYSNLNMQQVNHEDEIFPVLRRLFPKEEK